jgi:hypothetical protein
MADPKPNQITACNLGQNGEKEFVVACKGRPFSILTSPLLPVPTVTYLDYDLVRDIKLRMSSLQCRKLFYGGEKLRILGQISTTVQCIIDGSPLGNIQMKCLVVEDLKKHFNTHGIAGDKLHKKLVGQHAEMFPAKASTEPTDEEEADDKPKKKKRKKSKTDDASLPDKASTQPKAAPPDKAGLPSPPRPLCQGIWTRTQSYRGWHPEHGYGGPPGVLRDCYQDRRSGQAQGERPDCWDSEGPFHSEDSASSIHESSDEYDDEYTNISHIRQNLDTNICSIHANDVPANQAMTAHPPPFLTITEAREAMIGTAAAMTNSCLASPSTIIKKMTLNCQRAGMDTANTIYALQCAGIDINTAQSIEALQCAGLNTSVITGTVKKKASDTNPNDAPAKSNGPVKNDVPTEYFTKDGKSYNMKDLKNVWKLRKEGRDVPLSLRHVPRRHGPDWCHAGCDERRSLVPHACGYHIGWGDVVPCSEDCNGGYCDHYQDDSDYTEQEDGMS